MTVSESTPANTRRSVRQQERLRKRKLRRRAIIATVAVLGCVAGGTVAVGMKMLDQAPREFASAAMVVDQPELAAKLQSVVSAASSAVDGAASGVDTSALKSQLAMVANPARVPAVTADSLINDVQQHTAEVAAATQKALDAAAAKKAAEEKAAADAAAAQAAALAQTQTPSGAQALAQKMAMDSYGWGSDQFGCLYLLWNKESSWNYQAENSSSGAYGIPQSLPGSKMATIADDWQTNPATQIAWGLKYISSVYGSPCSAWGHSQATSWY